MTFEDTKRFTVSRATSSELLWLLSQKIGTFPIGSLSHLPSFLPPSLPPLTLACTYGISLSPFALSFLGPGERENPEGVGLRELKEPDCYLKGNVLRAVQPPSPS